MDMLKTKDTCVKLRCYEGASFADEVWALMHKSLKAGNWSEAPKAYSLVHDELTYIGQVLSRGTRIVVPGKLRKRVLE